MGFPGGSDGKASACSAGDPGSIPGSGRSPGEGNGSPFQYSCLESPMDGGAWWVTVHGVAESDTAERLHFHFLPHIFGLPKGVLVVKNPPANAGDSRDTGSIPEMGRAPGGGHSNPLQ